MNKQELDNKRAPMDPPKTHGIPYNIQYSYMSEPTLQNERNTRTLKFGET